MKDDNKENIQQTEGGQPKKGVETPVPPQRQDPRNAPAAEAGEEKSGKTSDRGADRDPSANEKAGKPAPANNREEQNKPPTTTTNR